MGEIEQRLLPWPIHANLLERRRSCELTHKVAPCIEKAVTHLYQLEDRLVAAFEDDGERGSIGQANSDQGQNWLVTTGPDDKKQKTVRSASGARLEIMGTGLTKPGKRTENEANLSLADFGERVIRDTLLLLGRLETDRVNTAQSLANEKQRVAMLKAKIDEYAHRRLHFMPIAVQKEHELCAINIQELKWHIAYKGRARDRIMEKFTYAEKVNKALKAEIDYINERRPWVQAKLEEEDAQMEEIQKHQDTTDTELAGALAMLKSMEDKFSKAEMKAENERNKLDSEVDAVRQQLNKDTDELSKYKMQYTSFVHSIHDSRERLREMDEESEVLAARHERAIKTEKIQEEKVNYLKEKIKEQEHEKVKLMEENSKLKVEKDEQKTELESQNALLDLEVKKETKKLREKIATNRALEREIRNLRKFINDSVKQKTEGEKVVKRAEMELAKIASEAEILEEEISKLTIVHDKLQTTLDREREKCEKTEEDLKTTADSLKKQLKDEAHARTVLQARIAADSSDLIKTRADANKKKEKSTKRAAEIERAVATIKKQVEKMEKAHEDRQKIISELDALLDKAKSQQNDAEKAFQDKLQELDPIEKEAKKKLLGLAKRIEEMEWRTEAIEKRMHDMSSSSIMMNRVLLATQEAIEELSEELNELNIQLHAGQGITETLENTLRQLKDRGIKSARDHSDHMRNREKALRQLEDALKVSLDENTKLAKEYTTTQNQFAAIKNKLLQTYEVALLKENSLKDKRELFDFRTRLHQALECYYKLRGAQTRAGILRFEEMADQNGERLNEIQTSLQKTLDNATDFLKVNNASHKAIRLQAEETANGSLGVSA